MGCHSVAEQWHHHRRPAFASVSIHCWFTALSLLMVLLVPFLVVTDILSGCLHLLPDEEQWDHLQGKLDKTYSHYQESHNSLSPSCSGPDPASSSTQTALSDEFPVRLHFCIPYALAALAARGSSLSLAGTGSAVTNVISIIAGFFNSGVSVVGWGQLLPQLLHAAR